MSIAPDHNFDDFEASTDAVVAELREQLTAEEWAAIEAWLNTPIDPETSARIDAEIDAEFAALDAEFLADLKITVPPFGGDIEGGDSGPSEPAGATETRSPRAVSLADIYDALDIGNDEHVSIFHKSTNGRTHAQVITAADAPALAAGLTGDVYFGVNPVNLPVGKGRRGTAADVARVVAIYADIDVKDKACRDLNVAHTIIDDVSAVLGIRPKVIIFSGGGLQPIWRVTVSLLGGPVLLRRFGRLVKVVGVKHGAKLDGVFDSARVLRVPGTLNHKYDPPARVSAVIELEAVVLTAAGVAERLDSAGVKEYDGDRDVLGKILSEYEDWGYGGQWCRYVQVATENWVTDELDGRHNCTLDRYVRLACMWRYRCLPDEAALQRALDALAERLAELRRQTGQTVGHYEVESMWIWAVDKVSRFTDEKVRSELGGHSHDDGGRFFAKGVGLLALKLANTVMRSITCGFNDTTERFYVYSDGVWRPDRGRIEKEIAALLGDRYRDSHAKTALDLIRLSDAQRLSGDPLRDYINVPNGMVDWKTGARVEHSPGYLSTVQLPHAYDPDAVCPRVDQFLMEVLPADCVESGFIWEVIGYAMYSGNPLHVAVLFHGKGRNGKGTLIRLLKALVGQHNCSAVGLHELVENRFRAATLYGKLANLAGDLDARWVGNTAMFKAITGGDLIQGEFKYGAAFDFTPWALPIYSANKAFGSSDSSEGWWSRWVVVPFPNVFTGTENRQLDTWLQTDAELRGVMRKGIAALPALMARGRFVEPESMNEAKETFIAASDAVRAWIAEQCTLESDAWEPRTKLYDAYAYRWQTAPDGSKTLSAREFYNRVEQIGGIVPATRKGIRGYKGIRLGAEAASQPAPGPRVKNGRSEP